MFPQCGGRLTDQHGDITAPDSDGDGFYDLDVDCVWELAADENKLIFFELTHMDIEEEPACGYDFLAV